MAVADELIPDITPELVAWLEANYPLPVWDGNEASAAEYHRRVGVHQLAQQFKAQLTDEHEAEDAQTAL